MTAKLDQHSLSRTTKFPFKKTMNQYDQKLEKVQISALWYN